MDEVFANSQKILEALREKNGKINFTMAVQQDRLGNSPAMTFTTNLRPGEIVKGALVYRNDSVIVVNPDIIDPGSLLSAISTLSHELFHAYENMFNHNFYDTEIGRMTDPPNGLRDPADAIDIKSPFDSLTGGYRLDAEFRANRGHNKIIAEAKEAAKKDPFCKCFLEIKERQGYNAFPQPEFKDVWPIPQDYYTYTYE